MRAKLVGRLRTIAVQRLRPLAEAVAAINLRWRHRLPRVPRSAPQSVQILRQAWQEAQLSDASSPGIPIAYYSLSFSGYEFPGERPWKPRWDLLRQITPYRGKRVLELGCNLALLSTHLLSEEGADSAMAVDNDPRVLSAARGVALAYGVRPQFLCLDFDRVPTWEVPLRQFKPDVVFALNIMNWVTDKERFAMFLAEWPELIYEGHDSAHIEQIRLEKAGFSALRLIGVSERERPLFYCTR